MPTGGSSFLSSLTKRKKSPEQLVKLAVACLHELPAVEDASWTCPAVDGTKATVPAMDGLNLGEPGPSKQQKQDELTSSRHSISSSAASNPDASRTSSAGSDAGASRRSSFFLSAFGKKEAHSHDSGSAPPPHSSAGSSRDGSAADASTSGKVRGISIRPTGLSVSKFFSDSSRKPPILSPQESNWSQGSVGHSGIEGDSVMERLAKRLSQMKLVLYGDGEKEVDKDKCVDLAENIIKEGLMPLLLDRFTNLPFEARKDAAQIFNNIARHNHAGFADPYIADHHFSILEQLINGYGHPEVALNCGSMLREAARHEKVARRILFSPHVWPFFDTFVHLPNFDVASDSFATLRDLLTKHKTVAAEFLEEEYEQVFDKYKSLLASDNYVTRRMSLKMLGEILLDRSNFNVMMRYISSKENLKMIMNLLRDKSASIQFEAFHVFKVFVANPKKPPAIVKILVTNRDKLVTYLTHFHTDKDDEQFREEKSLLVNTLANLDYEEAAT
ncbi:hypothetical protein NSK_008652 [Nannochloropsis salina CCMP1776]|uniref:Calcium-binding protein 39 n=1 Tax=Nannochloropsis salina CCMP1776 TaxID=1027361 RepID=A0A4D9CR72_9STRA|nr:hypothetical protein NSK_008652 [Nannochloropsis salina CCMP1776]|eukprot:TFJ80095.1 hypothetical protein NSK_008652 [Nannochloropsis salina CCMP1776]